MPPTATLEDIKAYQKKVEKDKITPHNLPPCPRCSVDSSFFKIHAFRERRFLIIIEMIIQAAHCSLVRFICPGCGKTFTFYPDFAIPHKHYTRPSIIGFCAAYLESDLEEQLHLFKTALFGHRSEKRQEVHPDQMTPLTGAYDPQDFP